MFKKLISFCIIASVVFSFAGCIKDQPQNGSANLVPYMGGYTEEGEMTEKLYGLMTADGKKAVEPLYDNYYTLELEGEKYYCMQILEGVWEPVCHSSLLVSADGEWQLEIKDNIVAISENRIICQQFNGSFNVYDYSGNKIFSGNENQSVDTNGNGFYNG